MAEIRTVTTLTKKRDEIARSIIAYERKLAQARADLSHVNATLAIFAGGGEPGGHRVYVDLARVFTYGEIARLCIAELAAGERTTRELAAALMASKGLDTADRVLAKSVCLSVVMSMRSCARRNKVRCVGKRGAVCVWLISQ
jgi:hypothetical protein